ncbi:hypothetical protein [Oceanicoccus sp. KOV_DT_Chl]|uniref:hypothetical protein n=1 Tax=Oceanicoccus sp. KOV_DT_Chl TaxID=1904639 RepID=UPI0011AFA21E|nr:hypothetical protein [Oceanicoccus sp. KOV_DT_Chl]
MLDKIEASKRFQQTIINADKATSELIDYASQRANNPVAALNALEQARLAQANADNAKRNLAITSNSNRPHRYSSQQIETLIRNALASLPVTVSADDPAIKTELEKAVSDLGMPTATIVNYQISATLDTEPLQQKQGWWWLRGALEMELTQIENGKKITLAKQRWPIKESSMDKAIVLQRARDHLNWKFSGYLYELLTDGEANN